MLAAYGSGAARASSDEGKRILNVDIGGGTTKLGLVENGKVVATAAIHIGGRLQVVENGKTVRLDPAGKHHAARAGFAWERGDIIEPADLQKVADTMADTLVAAILTRPLPDDIARLYLTEPIVDLGRIDGVMFSGGVAEYVYAREARDFGDLGQRLGRALRAHIASGALPWPVLPAGECIRATALGASEYSVQLSGNTSYISAPGRLLPRRNLQVLLPPFICAETIDPDALARAIRNHMTAFDVADTERDIALALRWSGLPSYPRLAAFAEGIRRGLAERIAKKLPLYIMLDGDVAQTLGHLLRDELHIASDLLVIDGVVLWDFDYIDLGRIRMPSYTVPVTIKSLVFSEDPRGPRPRQRLHHREHAHDHVHDHAHAHTHEHHHAPAHEHDHSHEHEHEHEHDHDHSHGHAHHKRKA
jgi:ethanolamine utilization protein EutA